LYTTPFHQVFFPQHSSESERRDGAKVFDFFGLRQHQKYGDKRGKATEIIRSTKKKELVETLMHLEMDASIHAQLKGCRKKI